MLHLVLFVLSAVLLFTEYLIRNKNYWRKRNVIQIDGVVRRFMLEKCSIGEIYKEIIDENPSYPHYGIFLGSSPTLLLKDLRDIETVLQSNFFSFNNRGIVTNPREPLADNMLFINNYNRWKLIKQKFSPMLTNMKMKSMIRDIDSRSRDFFVNITDNDTKEYSFKDFYSYITAIVAASIFGTKQTTKSDVNALSEMFYSINDASTSNNIIFYISNTYPTLFKLLNLKHFSKYNDYFVNFVKKVLENRRNDDGVYRNDILDSGIQLQANGTMRDPATGYEIEATDELLAAQYFLFFLGGVDNITISLQFTLLELAQNKNILNRLHDEIDTVYENCDNELTLEDLGRLEYLDMVVSETLRKYPPISALQRCCTIDTNLPSTGLRVGKGTIILIPVFALHRDPKLFPNPDSFDPERFSYENRKISKFAYIPFGEGQRKCLGVRFGKILLKYSVASILRRFTLLERKYASPVFAHSFFSLKDITNTVGLIPRNKTKF